MSRYFEYKKQTEEAYNELKQAYEEVKDSYAEMIFRLALVAEYKDETTGTHLVRIADYSTEIASGMHLTKRDLELIKYASPMHDIGKLIVPEEILKKPSGLTPEEREVMKKHTILGSDIFHGSRSALLRAAREICLTHHERYDGTGYPGGLKGKDIPLYGRIVSLADVFDALTSERPYKAPIDFDDAVVMITEQSGKQFDPKVVEAFLDRKKNIKDIWQATKQIEQFIDERECDPRV
ncbi:MAG TPA: HD domain-containing phosphohydrolase [Candidatus Omnitrophota bacterium]|nr:HD domain-containing phosphohydrolase [Candidatus Omnitrophota bacterium]